MAQSSWSIWPRTVFGFILAPVSPILLGVALEALLDLIRGDALKNLGEWIWAVQFSGLIGYPIALVLGLPLYIFFRQRGWNRILTYLIAGACLGFVMYLTYMPSWGDLLRDPSSFFERVYYTAHFIILGILFGTVASIAFWLIVRPDKIKTYRFWDET